MAPPTAYTDDTLAAYMHATLNATARVLGWSVAAGSYGQPVNECLRAAGLATASAATNVALLEAHARRAAWQAVVNHTAAYTDYTAANGTIKREQLWQHATQMLAREERHLAISFGVRQARLSAAVAVKNEANW